jgi:glycosyltransferase involved in cell wall biosynthesis
MKLADSLRRRTAGRAAPEKRGAKGQRRVLILVQNLPVPMDRRVWRQARALTADGYQVSVICPRGPGQAATETLEDVRIYRYTPPPTGEGALAYALEFAWGWALTGRLMLKVLAKGGIDVVQACNPPDSLFALGLPLKAFGKRFVFDHHDLCPELYVSRFGRDGGLALRALRFLERATFRSADRVISTNESYRQVAIGRGHVDPDLVTVVRNGPELHWAQPRAARPELKEGRAHLACYLGVMGPQDGLDWLVRAIDLIVHDFGRTDCQFVLMGFGECVEDLEAQTTRLGLDEWVTFTGRVTGEPLYDYLATADVGLSPDPMSPFNAVSTMNKTLEYMAFGLPVVAFDLPETRVSAGDAAIYADPGDLEDFAKSIDHLLSDPERRAQMGDVGRRRIQEHLAWELQIPNYLHVYDQLFSKAEAGS